MRDQSQTNRARPPGRLYRFAMVTTRFAVVRDAALFTKDPIPDPLMKQWRSNGLISRSRRVSRKACGSRTRTTFEVSAAAFEPSEDSTPAKPHGRQPLETPQYTLVQYSTLYSLLYTAQYTLVHSRNPHTRVSWEKSEGGFGVSGPR